MSKSTLDNISKFEEKIGKLELLAMEVASSKAQKALIEHLDDPERILEIFDSTQSDELVTTGVRNLHDQKLKRIKKRERTYYRAIYTRTFDLVMRKFLNDLVLKENSMNVSLEKFAATIMRDVREEKITDFTFTNEEVAVVEADLKKSIDFKGVESWARDVSSKLLKFHTRVKINFKHNLLKTIHPENPQIHRQQVARVQLEKPKAMDRAVRMEVASLFSSIPIGVISALALYAGVDSGLLKPFDAEGLDTETHIKYMNRYIFYNGFIPGLILGLFSNTWGKIQMDYFMDSKGGFDKAIMHKDGEKSFWRFYLKNLIKNLDNKWKANHIFMLKFVKANVPAAVLTIIVFNAYGLGRFDVDSFIVGYMMIFLTAMSGFSMKIENAFEKSSSWIYNKIPRRLRAHPDAQKYIETKLQNKKIIFSWFENIWSIVIKENGVRTMFALKENVQIGTRSFMRLVFGGETPTDLVTKTADILTKAFKTVPGVESAMKTLKDVVSNNYEALERYPQRLLEAGEALGTGGERVYENANLPNNVLAEVLGKFGAAVSTIGAFAGMPYLGVYLLGVMSEKRVQLKGRIFKKTLQIRELEREASKKELGSCSSFL